MNKEKIINLFEEFKNNNSYFLKADSDEEAYNLFKKHSYLKEKIVLDFRQKHLNWITNSKYLEQKVI